MPDTLSQDEILALVATRRAAERAIQEADDLEPGTYEIDRLLRIRGRLRKGEPFSQALPHKACPWTLLKLALENLLPDERERIVQAGIRASLLAEKPDVEDLQAVVRAHAARLAGATVTVMSGRVTGNVEIDVLPALPYADMFRQHNEPSLGELIG